MIYSVVPGFFVQDTPGFDGHTADTTADDFGLLDKSPSGWAKLSASLDSLNSQAPSGTSYKLLWCARHAQGFHNMAEAKYGTPLWESHWAKLTTDGELVWGPDPNLSPTGEAQVERAHQAWKALLAKGTGVPLPRSLYCSPMRRAARTLTVTWRDILLGPAGLQPKFMDGIRETVGVHTCDMRSPKSVLGAEYPDFVFEDGFEEEDLQWSAEKRETHADVDVRVRKALDKIFSTDASTVISITAHDGVLRSILATLSHQPVFMPVAGVIPVLVKSSMDE
ncbi:hypothetical protein RQP46_005452 [Phenoliferia psychrophenolica]